MKSRKDPPDYTPFQEIKALLEAKRISLPDRVQSTPGDCEAPGEARSEEELFLQAMQSVTPISKDKHIERTSPIRVPDVRTFQEDAEVLSQLMELVRHGTGFNIFDTPEYIEGTGYNVHPEIARRLHRGDFSIQAHIDLHGLIVEDAKEAFETFMKWAVYTGRTGVLIIHGRGLSSSSEPVLKKKVVEWLTRGLWRKWVVAYSSARSCDGGAGATYVLLRQRPVSKRLKIRHKKTGQRVS